jgi:hypothetical protein
MHCQGCQAKELQQRMRELFPSRLRPGANLDAFMEWLKSCTPTDDLLPFEVTPYATNVAKEQTILPSQSVFVFIILEIPAPPMKTYKAERHSTIVVYRKLGQKWSQFKAFPSTYDLYSKMVNYIQLHRSDFEVGKYYYIEVKE